MQGLWSWPEWLEPSEEFGRPSCLFFFCVRQDYEELEKQLKQVFKERSTTSSVSWQRHQENLSGIKTNLQVRWKLIFSAAKYRESMVCLSGLMHEDFHNFFLPVLNIFLGLNMGVIIYYYMSFERKCHLKCSLRIWGLQIQEWEICAWQSHQFLTASQINFDPWVFYITK